MVDVRIEITRLIVSDAVKSESPDQPVSVIESGLEDPVRIGRPAHPIGGLQGDVDPVRMYHNDPRHRPGAIGLAQRMHGGHLFMHALVPIVDGDPEEIRRNLIRYGKIVFEWIQAFFRGRLADLEMHMRPG